MHPQTSEDPYQEIMRIVQDQGIGGIGPAVQLLIQEALRVDDASSTTLALSGSNPLDCGPRSDRALKIALAEIYLDGFATAKTLQLLGEERYNRQQVQNAATQLDDELEKWRNRKLPSMLYLFLGYQRERVRYEGRVCNFAIISAIGVDEKGRRSVLGVSISAKKGVEHWTTFLRDIHARGVQEIRMAVDSNILGAAEALAAIYPNAGCQLCQTTLRRDLGKMIDNAALADELDRELQAVFQHRDVEQADITAGKLIARCPTKPAVFLRRELPKSLIVNEQPPKLRCRLRTSNMIAGLEREILALTRPVGLFPNQETLLRLVTALLMEQSERWETGRRYLSLSTA
jgi:putative transposase